MKPNFALNLTEDRIALLQRTGKGWLPLGEVMFGAPDMEDQLTALREKAANRAPRGITTKLVIPNSQILYTTMTVAATTEAARRDEIRAALAGLTPYAVDDLVFDWSGTGPDLQVAVVARETLDEAEGFATERAFRPISFVAIPPEGQFDGEPMFGTTAFSVAALGKGRRLERDLVVMHLIGADTVDAAAADEDEAEVPQETDVAPAETLLAAVDDAPSVDDAASSDEVAAAPPEDVASPMTTAEIFPEAAEVAAEVAEVDAPPVVPVEEMPPAPRFTIAPVADPATSVVSASLPEMDDEAPFADVSDLVADAAPSGPATDDDLPPAPSTAALMAFASRRAAAETAAKPVGAAPARGSVTPMPGLLADRLAARAQATEATLPPQPLPIPPRDAPRMVGGAAAVTAPVVPGGKKRKPAAMPVPDMPRKPLTKPGGTFASSPPVRGKPRFLGLILTGILILFLALVAAWSSFFLASRGDEDGATQVAAVAPEPEVAIEDEALADGQLPEDGTADVAVDVPVAEPPGPAAVVEDVPLAAPETETAATEDAGPAPETGVDVFDTGTTGPSDVGATSSDAAVITSAGDAPLVAPDVADLAAPVASADVVPGAQLPPPPFGTEYTFNPDGTLQGTPDGILTPDGVRLVSGPPQVRPPARPAAIAAAVAPPVAPVVPETLPVVDGALPGLADAPGVVGADPALADARPRSRPATLVVPDPASDDDAALATDGPILASSPRPRTRPETVLAAGEEARRESEAASLATASAAAGSAAEAAILEVAAAETPLATPSGSRLAVSVSRVPAPRPRDLERAVAAALAAATRAPDPEPEPEPEPARVAAAPTAPEADDEPEVESGGSQAPTSGSVADRATFANAINLSRINLIGVYGSQSNRYALIRQGNGRYKRVEVGDRIDGGTVAAITANEVRYQKGGRLIALELPDT
jgi:hypothetical protein